MKNFPLILLANGNASRMGTPKGLTEYNGRPWVVQQLRRFSEAHGHRVVVVLGHHSMEYLRAVPWMQRSQSAEVETEGLRVTTVLSSTPEHGQFSLLQCGARAIIGEKFNGAFVLPIDVPAAQPEVWSHLRNVLTGDAQAAIPVWQGRGGQPVLLSHRYLETLLQMPEESRLEVQLHVLDPSHVVRHEVDDASVCMNINTPDQWRDYAKSQNA